MSRLVLDGFTNNWENEGPSSSWTLSLVPVQDYTNETVPALSIEASGLGAGSPFARRVFAAPVDLRPFEEIHLCLRSSRPGDGTPSRPFYLAAEFYADISMTPLLWQRMIPVTAAGSWEFHELWLGDMPDSLRTSAGVFAVRSLNPAFAFEAVLDQLLAVRKEPLLDADAALLKRLHNRFKVDVSGTLTSVPVIMDVPENPGTRTMPYILISPWSVRLQRTSWASGEVVDNYVASGAAYRPSATALDLEYRIDAFTQDRAQKAKLLENIVLDFARRPLLDVYGRPVECASFWPDDELLATIGLGRTPLFYRFTLPIELAERTLAKAAVPFISTEFPDRTAPAEVLPA